MNKCQYVVNLYGDEQLRLAISERIDKKCDTLSRARELSRSIMVVFGGAIIPKIVVYRLEKDSIKKYMLDPIGKHQT